MLAKVTAPPLSTLSDTQRLVVSALTGNPLTTHQLQAELKRNYSVVNRALKDLAAKNWVEIDPLLSGGRSNAWRLKQVPTDAIELRIDTAVGQESVSFNRYFEMTAKQLSGGRQPKLQRDLQAFFNAIAMLGYLAAVEFVEPGKVTETQLLEARSTVQSFVMSLENTYSIAQQLLDDERIWHANTLTEGVLRKTDRHLTPGDMARYAKLITDSFITSEDKSNSTEDDNDNNEEEQESADG